MAKRNHVSIPPRWLNCPRKGLLMADKFIPFKTPLDHKYDDEVPDECKFNIQMFISSIKSAYQKQVGLIIDLTNTTRFYNKNEVEDMGCKYVKLQCRGHGETPDTAQTALFIDVVDKFIKQKPLEVIGIHCTHGFNRTGFLICSYLVEKMDWSIEAAIHTFAQTRPPGIYKGGYIKSLFRIYDDEDYAPPTPVLPDWCNEEEEDPGLDDDGNEVDESGPSKKRKIEAIKHNAAFMNGVSGATLVMDQPRCSEVQHKVQDMCGWSKTGFPGGQPVSMDVKNIKVLHDKKYFVSWKADGTRYMMLIDGPGSVFMLDRDNCVFSIANLDFPRRKDLSSHITNTLLDGELVIDIDKASNKKFPRYLIYDIVTFEGKEVGKTDFGTRLACIRKEIYEPRQNKQKEGLLDRSREPFGVRQKPFYDLSLSTRTTDVKKLLSPKFCESIGHETDGLVFQPGGPNDVYMAGRQDDVLKWKPPHLNSIDFKLNIVRQSAVGMLTETKGLLYVGGFDRPLDQIKVTNNLHQYNNKIIECSWDMEKRCWKFMRERTDKSFPNAYTTAIAVVESIKNPVTEESLLKFIHSYAWRPQPKSSSMGPPPVKH
ncbi:mRNA-capping enzyme-like [Watersipora subatra]|uniref:mRNA-capping enzyme-like n=1 Tax=Watersipora subatra TaxID=2589382 RepID=UPI00355B8322